MGAQNSITLIIQSFGLIFKRSISESLHQYGSKILIRTLILAVLLTVTATGLAAETNVTSRSDCRIIDGVPIRVPYSNYNTELVFRDKDGTHRELYFAYVGGSEPIVVNTASFISAIEPHRELFYPGPDLYVPSATYFCFEDSPQGWPTPAYPPYSESIIQETSIHPIRKNINSIWSGGVVFFPIAPEPVIRGYYVIESGRLWTEDLALHNNSLRPIVIEDYFMVFGRPWYGRMDITDFNKNTIVNPGKSFSFNLTFVPTDYYSGDAFHLGFTINGHSSTQYMFGVNLMYYATEADVPEDFELPEPTRPYTPPRPPGDLNNDGVVDVADFIHGGSREL